MPSAALHKHKEAGSALNPNQGCQQREARLITARGPADLYHNRVFRQASAGRTELAIMHPIAMVASCNIAWMDSK
jgi:hypothetical protein